MDHYVFPIYFYSWPRAYRAECDKESLSSSPCDNEGKWKDSRKTENAFPTPEERFSTKVDDLGMLGDPIPVSNGFGLGLDSFVCFFLLILGDTLISGPPRLRFVGSKKGLSNQLMTCLKTCSTQEVHLKIANDSLELRKEQNHVRHSNSHIQRLQSDSTTWP